MLTSSPRSSLRRAIMDAIVLAGLATVGCSRTAGNRHEPAAQTPAKAPSGTQTAPAPAGTILARCTATPECPATSHQGETTTARGNYRWTIENRTAQPAHLLITIEIHDSEGHTKKKDIPAEIKASAEVEDSDWFNLVTTYSQAAKVQVTAKITIKSDSRILAQASDVCSFSIP